MDVDEVELRLRSCPVAARGPGSPGEVPKFPEEGEKLFRSRIIGISLSQMFPLSFAVKFDPTPFFVFPPSR